MKAIKMKAIKDDTGKLDWTLIPWDEIEDMCRILHDNCDENGGKYPRDNWKKHTKEDARRYYLGAAMRHLKEMFVGNVLDDGPKGDGNLHSAHLMCCAAMIAWHDKKERVDEDN